MSKSSDWKVVATEGATVDGRTITAAWIKDMAELYSHDQTTALIWPEHKRSDWSKYEGKNWGVVEELKAEKRAGKLRLFAKLTPNQYLLDANVDGQKLFTSIEPNPDYKGQGRCYLMGLAVTDSPASTGTTRLKFSKDSEHEYSQLEELDLSEFTVSSNPLAQAFSTIAKFFQSGGEMPPNLTNAPDPSEDDEPMDPKQFNQMMGKLDGIESKQNELETKQTELAGKVEQFSVKPTETPPEDKEKPQTFTAEQFSTELEKQLKPITEKVDGLETQFNKLSEEVPGQRPGESGAAETMEVF